MDPLLLIIGLLASYRLTRLIVKDTLLDEARWWFLNRWPSDDSIYPDEIVSDRSYHEGVAYGSLPTGVRVYLDEEGWKALDPSKWGELIACPWCVGFWISALWNLLAFTAWHWWPHGLLAYLGLTLAYSALIGFISQIDA